MGGPVESQHAARIARLYGRIDGLLPYDSPSNLLSLHPGYALHPEPGSITDDTYIRREVTRFFIDQPAPRTPGMMADYLLANAADCRTLRAFWSKVHLISLRLARSRSIGFQCSAPALLRATQVSF